MFYEKQSEIKKDNYKKMLTIMGSLSKLFSENESPYLEYRILENIFCKYFEANNLARTDCSADASKDNIGVGLKTWIGSNNQKIAEFGKLRDTYADLPRKKDIVKKISSYRNERIRVTMNMHGLDDMVYHIVKRVPYKMEIYEYPFHFIDIDNVIVDSKKSKKNNIYFSDGINTYHFSLSKNTLYMLFNDMELLDDFDVKIMDDPYDFLEGKAGGLTKLEKEVLSDVIDRSNKICLRLYSNRGNRKYVAEKSGLNQWNASGRKRHADEVYIPYPAEDRRRRPDFFPGRNMPFNLKLPDGSWIQAKICQDDGKAIMSNPNKDLGEWLLRKVFEVPEGTLITYEMLRVYGIDSVIFTKISDYNYSVEFSEIGTYEKFYGLEE